MAPPMEIKTREVLGSSSTTDDVREILSYPAGEICSSYGAEGVALLRALEWLDQKNVATAAICTDSLSLHKALANII